MISTKLHWIGTPTSGRLAICARPRGGEWLESELLAWKALGIDTVVSLLEPSEESELDLSAEHDLAQLCPLDFISYPIPDRDIPASNSVALLETLKIRLQAGKSIAIHCRQGVGRAGMIAATLLILFGIDPDNAVELVSAARGVTVPETKPQREWIVSALIHRQ